jgi:hypothetical protein
VTLHIAGKKLGDFLEAGEEAPVKKRLRALVIEGAKNKQPNLRHTLSAPPDSSQSTQTCIPRRRNASG